MNLMVNFYDCREFVFQRIKGLFKNKTVIETLQQHNLFIRHRKKLQEYFL
jgi:hypothetical protein